MKKLLVFLPLIVFCLPGISHAAFLQVQTASLVQTTSASPAITVSATGAGNLIVLSMQEDSGSETLTSVTDNEGNAYVVTTVIASAGNEVKLYQAYGIQSTGGATTITGHWSGAAITKRGLADEYSGFTAGTSNASVFDVTKTGTGTNPAGGLAVSTLTPAGAGELIVSDFSADTNSNTWTAGTNYVVYGTDGFNNIRSEYRLSSGASETAPVTGTDGVGTHWVESATAFKVGSAAAASSCGFFCSFEY